jgi:ribosome maturation factor RimP
MSARAELLDGLSGPLADLGVDLEDVEVSRAGRRHVVRVVVDCDGGVDLDRVAAVSQAVSSLLDEGPLAGVVEGPFVLEVTSPGVDRPLTEPRHWRRAVDRLVRVEDVDGAVIEGRILGVTEGTSVELLVQEGVVVMPLSRVQRAVVQVEFNRDARAGGAQADALGEGTGDDEKEA